MKKIPSMTRRSFVRAGDRRPVGSTERSNSHSSAVISCRQPDNSTSIKQSDPTIWHSSCQLGSDTGLPTTEVTIMCDGSVSSSGSAGKFNSA